MTWLFTFLTLYPFLVIFEFINVNTYYLSRLKNIIKEKEFGVLQMLDLKPFLLVPT